MKATEIKIHILSRCNESFCFMVFVLWIILSYACRLYALRSLDDERLAVVAVEMTTRLVARPEDDDDDDEVHDEERDPAVGYHCH